MGSDSDGPAEAGAAPITGEGWIGDTGEEYTEPSAWFQAVPSASMWDRYRGVIRDINEIIRRSNRQVDHIINRAYNDLPPEERPVLAAEQASPPV